MVNLRNIAERLAKAATRVVGRHWGERFPFYYVCEYPKSGGTWLGQMLGDCLQIPFPRYSVFPSGCESVILSHWSYEPRLRRVVYLYRDGRDVMTSFFFHRLRVARQPSHSASRRVRRHLTAVYGRGYEDRDTGWLLARFIDHEFRHPGLGSRLSWSRHVEDWGAPAGRPHVTYVSYEGLLADARRELARVIAEITGQPVEADRVAATVEKFSMQAQTGRRPGQEDSGHHVRKGIAGDWKNHFTAECAEIFHHHAGDTLVALGYEADSRWVERTFADGDDR